MMACTPAVFPQPALFEPIKQALPIGLAFGPSHFPIQDGSFATAIRPQPQGHQQHYLLACSKLSLSASAIPLRLSGRLLIAQPNAIELHHRRYFRDGTRLGLA